MNSLGLGYMLVLGAAIAVVIGVPKLRVVASIVAAVMMALPLIFMAGLFAVVLSGGLKF